MLDVVPTAKGRITLSNLPCMPLGDDFHWRRCARAESPVERNGQRIRFRSRPSQLHYETSGHREQGRRYGLLFYCVLTIVPPSLPSLSSNVVAVYGIKLQHISVEWL